MTRQRAIWAAAIFAFGVALGCSNDPPPIQEAKKVSGEETKADVDFTGSKAPEKSDPAAVAVVNAAIAAHTGNDPGKLAVLKKVAFTRAGRATFGGPELVDQTWKFHVVWPDKIRHEADLPGGLSITHALNGDTAWGYTPGPGAMKTTIPPGRVKDFRVDGSAEWLWMLFPLIEPNTKIGPERSVEVRGKPTEAVHVWADGVAEAVMYFDRETKLLSRMVFNGRESETSIAKTVTMYSTREYHGIKLPEKMVLEVNGKIWAEWTMTSLDPMSSVDPKLFENP